MSSLSSIAGSTSGLSSFPTNSATGTLSVGGLITGLNTDQLIQGLLAVNKAQITSVQARQSAVSQQETAYKKLQAQLLSFQGAASNLAPTFNGPFDGRTASSSNTTALTAAASSRAVAGVYTVKVNALAQANEVAAQNFASLTSQIAQGHLAIGIGTGASSATVTIDGTNNTLQGLANAINSAGAGVSATIINDGSAQPYRLLLTANKTGTANAITTAQFTASGGGGTQPTFATTVQSATDASISLGSGAVAGDQPLTITSGSNTIDGVINGVTLNLAAAGQTAQVTVANDTDTAGKAVQNFVSAYNGVIATIAADVKYDPQTNTAGPLLGDPSINAIEDRLRSLLTGAVAGVNPRLNNLGALGITSDATGQLQIDSGKLSSVLSGQVSGVTLADVRNLFALSGQSTNPGVAFANATTATKASTAPYGVIISQAAHQAVLTAGGAPPASLATASSFTLTVDGRTSGPLTVAAGSYTSAQLVQALQAQVNGDGVIGDQQVTVGLASGNLTFTSGAYGSAASLAISGAAFLGFSTATSATGQDVAGSFQVSGVASPEPATGRGQLLTGNTGNANTDSLALRVSLLDSQTNPTTPVANVTVTRGLAAQLGDTLNNLLDPISGQLQTIDQSFQDKIAAYQKTIDQLNQAYTTKQSQLTQQFVQLETTVNNLKTAGGFLTAQTAALQSLTSSSSSKTGG